VTQLNRKLKNEEKMKHNIWYKFENKINVVLYLSAEHVSYLILKEDSLTIKWITNILNKFELFNYLVIQLFVRLCL
jgi:hypothetical protein